MLLQRGDELRTFRPWQTQLEGRRRFAKALNRFQSGVYGRDWRDVRLVTLTTREGFRNDWKELMVDFKVFIRLMRDAGWTGDYCFAPEMSPGKGLLHLHGMFRGGGAVPQWLLSLLWECAHGAPVVYIEAVKCMREAEQYAAKECAKWAPEMVGWNGRLVMSKGWMPRGWQAVRKVLMKWAGSDGYEIEGQGVWQRVNDLYKRWCEGRTVGLRIGAERFVMTGAELRTEYCG